MSKGSKNLKFAYSAQDLRDFYRQMEGTEDERLRVLAELNGMPFSHEVEKALKAYVDIKSIVGMLETDDYNKQKEVKHHYGRYLSSL